MISLYALLISFAPSPVDDDLYAETFSVVADLDDGSYALLQMAISNMGPGEQNGICRYIFVPADGPAETDGKSYDREEWKATAEAFEVGPCRLDATDSVRMLVVTGEVSVEVRLAARERSVVPPNHGVKTSDGAYEMDVLIPSAAADLRVTKGAATRRLSGRGFMVHSRSTDTPGNIARRWARFRALDEGNVHLAQIRFPRDGGDASGWSWGPSGDPSPVSEAKIGSKPGPEFMLMMKTVSGSWRIRSKKLLFRDAPLERYGWLGALLGKLLGNPVTYHFRGELAAGAKRSPGILEVSQVE